MTILTDPTISLKTGSNSATQFGEISPLWQNFKRFWAILEGLFCNWQNFEPTLAKIVMLLGIC